MGIVLEKEGKTVSEATISACEELGVSRSEVDVEVLQESSKGVLGIGSKNAKIRITVKNDNLSEKGLKSKKALESILEYLIPTYSVGIKETADRIKLDIKDTARKVRKIKKPIALDPMTASERRMAYIALKREGGVGYETKVEQDQKRIIITPQQSRG